MNNSNLVNVAVLIALLIVIWEHCPKPTWPGMPIPNSRVTILRCTPLVYKLDEESAFQKARRYSNEGRSKRFFMSRFGEDRGREIFHCWKRLEF